MVCRVGFQNLQVTSMSTGDDVPLVYKALVLSALGGPTPKSDGPNSSYESPSLVKPISNPLN